MYTIRAFIKKATEKHGDKFDYSLIKEKNILTKTKLNIKCNTCKRVFHPWAKNHLNGSGCPSCSHVKYDKQIFINKAKNFHKEKYDYSLVEFKTINNKIKIICKIHGVFEQRASDHLCHGCKYCSSVVNKKSKQKVIDDFNKVHGKEKYNYSLMEYKNAQTKINIICNSCNNQFLQKPINHRSGQGCPKCALARTSKKINK